MSETERYLKTWPCGCQEWTIATVDGGNVEDEIMERFEPCPEYRKLRAEAGRIEAENARAVAASGRPDASTMSEAEDVAGKIERHHWGEKEVRVLDT